MSRDRKSDDWGMACMYCGRSPDSAGVIFHQKFCPLHPDPREAFPEAEHSPWLSSAQKVVTPLEAIIRNLCREEISQHVEMAKKMALFVGQLAPDPSVETMRQENNRLKEQLKKVSHRLDLARTALVKIAASNPAAAAQRAQLNMPVGHDIARLTIGEIERHEAEDGG